ncbi:Keratin, type I cytoskeletal 18 [Saguinus oedipus]|uniref:Keratin, type I cytoskeletal 18 n=1 Tax=Saguinus oedipus TaxID=9490 RepID=A0ABQ9U6G9_SAGOE|nr:Keratin, type I cytoskeletal 18 [Saguinus oedipus]
MASICAGAGGSGSWNSVTCSNSFPGGMESGGLAAGMVRGLVRLGGIQNEKDIMQSLNDPLASYLDRVRGLETENWQLENKIQKHLEKKEDQVRDWSHYFKTIEDLRAQTFANTVDDAYILLQIDSAYLAVDDFIVKYETELAMRQSVDSDIHGLHKVIDDTNKNHKEEVKDLQAQIASSGLTTEVDASKSQDLTKIVVDNQAQCDELAWKN